MGFTPLKVQRAYYLGKWLNCEYRFVGIFNFLQEPLLNKPILYD